MGARIVGIIFLVLLVIGGVYVYRHYKQQQSLESGAVHCIGCMSPEDEAKFQKVDHGDAPVPAGEHNESRAQLAANEAATPSQEPAAATPYNMAPQPSVPPGGIMPDNTRPMQNMPQPQSGYALTNTSSNTPAYTSTGTLPAMSSQTADAPNGMRFGGTGTYQWYRQGDLTWRIDTASGRSCIVYATMEEWRKRIVMSHGCGSAA